MGNIVFATGAELRSATISTGPSAAGGGGECLLRREPADALILTSSDRYYVVVDLGEPKPIRLVAPLYVSASPSATWRVRAADTLDATTGAPKYDSGPMIFGRGELGLKHRRGRLHDWIWSDTPIIARYWRVDFYDFENPEARLLVGNLVLSEAWQPSNNIVYGWSMGVTDPSRVPRAVAGRRDPLNRRPYMTGKVAFDVALESDMFGMAWDLDEEVGTTEAVLILIDPSLGVYRQKKAVWGLFTSLEPIVNPYFKIYAKSYEIEELIP